MNIVITMAGIGSRFREAGYQVPKYMIEVHGKTLFEWSMESLAGFNNKNNKYYFIVRREDEAAGFIEETCGELGLTDCRVIEIDRQTDGQATTAMLAAEFWDENDSLLIYNIDTFVEPGEMNESQIEGDGFIPCFHAPGSHWSFVELDAAGRAVRVKEKERISDNCTLGAYYFRTAGLYTELYREYYETGSVCRAEESSAERKEKYVAPLYNYMIGKGKEVRISIVDYDKVHVLGTPEELKVFADEYRK